MVEGVMSCPPKPISGGDEVRGVSQEDYPFTGHFIQLGNHRVHYLDEGEGDPVVMLHGNPSWSIYYRKLVHALKGSHRCIVPDHIGCGFSDKPDDSTYRYTFSQRVEDLENFLDKIQLSQPMTLVLHD